MAQLPRFEKTVLTATAAAPASSISSVSSEFWILGVDALYHQFIVNADGVLQDTNQTATAPVSSVSMGTVQTGMMPVSGASVTLYREGATANGTQAGTSPLTINVHHNGAIAGSDTVFLGTDTATTYAVDSVSSTTVVVSGFAGVLSVTTGTRIVPSNTKPTLYSDDQGGATKSNPLATDSNGHSWCYLASGHYDVLVSGANITSRLYESQHVGTVVYS